MRRCSVFCRRRVQPDEAIRDEGDVTNEKCVGRPRNWSAIASTALRLLQFAYLGFAYHSLHAFQRSSYFHDDGPWQRPPSEMRHSRRTMRWVLLQASVLLMYHSLVLVVPRVLRLLRATRRPSAGLVTLFGDGCAMVTLLNIMVHLDASHEEYCHSPPPRGDLLSPAMFRFGGDDREHSMMRHRAVCRPLDVMFGLGGLAILSYLLTAAVTARRAKRQAPSIHAKVEQDRDVEQGVAPRPAEAEEAHPQAARQRQHSPPPPYHPLASELAQGHPGYDADDAGTGPRGRASMETVSSLGLHLVPDGWRAPEEPPVYSSRPPSLYHAPA